MPHLRHTAKSQSFSNLSRPMSPCHSDKTAPPQLRSGHLTLRPQSVAQGPNDDRCSLGLALSGMIISDGADHFPDTPLAPASPPLVEHITPQPSLNPRHTSQGLVSLPVRRNLAGSVIGGPCPSSNPYAANHPHYAAGYPGPVGPDEENLWILCCPCFVQGHICQDIWACTYMHPCWVFVSSHTSLVAHKSNS